MLPKLLVKSNYSGRGFPRNYHMITLEGVCQKVVLVAADVFWAGYSLLFRLGRKWKAVAGDGGRDKGALSNRKDPKKRMVEEDGGRDKGALSNGKDTKRRMAEEDGGRDKGALSNRKDFRRMVEELNKLKEHVEHVEEKQSYLGNENKKLRRQLEVCLGRQRELEDGLKEVNARLESLVEQRSKQDRLKDWLKRDNNKDLESSTIFFSGYSRSNMEGIVHVWQCLSQPERWVLRLLADMNVHLVKLRSPELKEQRRRRRVAQRKGITQFTLMWEDIINENQEKERDTNKNRHNARTSTGLEPPSTDQEGLTSSMEEILLGKILKVLEDEVLKENFQEDLDEILEELEEILEERQAIRKDKKRWDKRAFRILKLEREQRKAKRRMRKKLKSEKRQEEWMQQKNPEEDWISNAARDLKRKKKEMKDRRKAYQKERERQIKSRIFKAWNDLKAEKHAEKERREKELLLIIEIEKDLRRKHREWKRKFKKDFQLEEEKKKAQRKEKGAMKRRELRSRIIQEAVEREERRKLARERRRQALREILKREKDPARKSKEVSQPSMISKKGSNQSVKGSPLREYEHITESQEKSEFKRSQGNEGEGTPLRLVQKGNKWQLWRKVGRPDDKL
ncbi:trichohyalin-like [Macrobrachium nipponense]|uniref:trichohyalin-like n=1 Tax=Macrobrachium nipponense TaxID=159736 RepID=UPI0030C83874